MKLSQRVKISDDVKASYQNYELLIPVLTVERWDGDAVGEIVPKWEDGVVYYYSWREISADKVKIFDVVMIVDNDTGISVKPVLKELPLRVNLL